MKIVALFLLIACIFDVIKPFFMINKQRVNLQKSWGMLAQTKGFGKFAFSIAVNIIAIIFFAVFLLQG